MTNIELPLLGSQYIDILKEFLITDTYKVHEDIFMYR